MATDDAVRSGGVATAFSSGFGLSGSCIAVIRQGPGLLLAPAVALVVAAVSFLSEIVFYGGVDRAFGGDGVVVALRSLPFLLVGHVAAVLAEAVVVGAARIRLAGGQASLGDGWVIAARRGPALVAYAVIRTIERTISFILATFRLGFVSSLLDAIWDFATFLAIPVILFERRQGTLKVVRRSAHLVRSAWGPQLVAQSTIGFASFFVALPFGLACAGIGYLGFGATGAWGGAIVVLVVLDVVVATLSAVLSAAVFRYVHGGHVSDGFTQRHLDALYRPKPAKSGFWSS